MRGICHNHGCATFMTKGHAGGAAAASCAWIDKHSAGYLPAAASNRKSAVSRRSADDDAASGRAAQDSAQQGAAVANAKLPIHSTLIESLAMHRSQLQPTTQSLTATNAAMQRLVLHLPAMLQDCALTAAEDATAAYMADLRRGVSGGTLAETSPHQSDLLSSSAPFLQSLSGGHQSSDALSSHQALQQSGVSSGSGDVSVVAVPSSHAGEQAVAYEGSSMLEVAVVPSLLDARLTSTRALERFRNQVGISMMIRSSVTDILHMYEDRYGRYFPV